VNLSPDHFNPIENNSILNTEESMLIYNTGIAYFSEQEMTRLKVYLKDGKLKNPSLNIFLTEKNYKKVNGEIQPGLDEIQRIFTENSNDFISYVDNLVEINN